MLQDNQVRTISGFFKSWQLITSIQIDQFASSRGSSVSSNGAILNET